MPDTEDNGSRGGGVLGALTSLRDGLKGEADELLGLVRRLADDLVVLLDQKVALLRAEAICEVRALVRDGRMLLVAGLLLVAALFLFNGATALLIAWLLPYGPVASLALGLAAVGLANLTMAGVFYQAWGRRGKQLPAKTVSGRIGGNNAP